jgi:hypothetical protein
MYPLGACTREGTDISFLGRICIWLPLGRLAATALVLLWVGIGHRRGLQLQATATGERRAGGCRLLWCCSAGAAGFSGSAPSGQAAALVLHCYPATLLHLPSTATRKWLLELELVSY